MPEWLRKLLEQMGIDEEKLNEKPFPTDAQGAVTDVRANKDIWQEKVDNSGFAKAQSNIRAGIEPLQDLLSHSLPEIGQGVMNSLQPPVGQGGMKVNQAPMPAPGFPDAPLPTPMSTPQMSGNKVSNFFEGAFDPAITYAKKVEQGRSADRQRKQQLDKHKRVSQDASSADRAMLSFARYSQDANARSQLARQATRDYDLNRKSRRGGLQEF